MTRHKSLTARGIVFDVSFHPTQDLLALGTIEGLLSFYDFTTLKETFAHLHHTQSIRSISFNPDGSCLFSVSKDKSLLLTSIEHEKVILQKQNAHKEELNKVKTLDEAMVATGDDSGLIKIWDLRTKKNVRKYKTQNDFISDFAFLPDKNHLISTSGDGLLSVFDIRTQKEVQVSDNQDDELLALVVCRNNSKVVVGTQSGTILLFSYGEFGDCTDRFPGHPESVTSLLKKNDNTVFTGSGDGVVREVGILPNVLNGNVSETTGVPIESMSLSSDRKWIAVSSHDEIVKFWDADFEKGQVGYFEEEQRSRPFAKKHRLKESDDESSDGEDKEIEDEDESESGSSEDSDISDKPKPKPKKTKKAFSSRKILSFDGLD